MAYLIEAKLSPEIKADIIFSLLPGAAPAIDGGDQGWDAEVEILDVLPLGIVAPIDPDALKKLADDWLTKAGGYDACCKLAEERNGGWE